MNDKQQIEEMRKIIYDDYKQWLDVTGVIPKGTTYYNECLGGAIDCANKLYNAGYRKLPENAVVLSREEYDELLARPLNAMGDLVISKIKNKNKEKIEKLEKTINEEYADISDYKDLVRKETAREIFNKLFPDSRFFNDNDVILIWQVKDMLKELAKQYGVEIKE